ncbi:hypothetical protein GCM10023093_26320 [Nemorincola caseinilytica]|uniref:Uncharacterized protein n=1 Tax=Nemorincola caseinilytica TaxID=2054315 RepID=A0ABP8NLX3_9BACT
MKLRTTLSLLLLLIAGLKGYAQPMEDIDGYLRDTRISETAKDLYKDGISSSDIDAINDIADSLCARNRETRPFYMYLACRVLTNTGGIPPGRLGKMCLKVTESDPTAVMGFLTSHHMAVERSFFTYWADALAYQFMNHCECVTVSCIATSQRKARLQCRAEAFAVLTDLYAEVKAKVCENEALAVAMTVPEVQAISKNRNSRAGIYCAPTKGIPYYWVKVWEDKDDKDATLDLLVDHESFTVYNYDAANNRIMTLDTWREKLH